MKVIPSGTIKRIHVDRRVIAHNRQHGTKKPAITIQTSNGPFKARRVDICGPSRFIQSEEPLSCGARLWVETYETVHYK